MVCGFLENVDDIFQQNGRVGNRTGSALIRLRDKLNCRINNSNSPGYATPTIWLISVPSVLAAAEEERVYIHASMPHPHLHPIHPLLPSRHTSFMPEISSSGLQPRKAQFGHHRTTDAPKKNKEITEEGANYSTANEASLKWKSQSSLPILERTLRLYT